MTCRIEQAIFTSAQTKHGDGYQLVTASSGLDAKEQRELASWGPSHDSLLSTRSSAASVNFFQLSSESFAVSKTTAAGAEYSRRGGIQVYTHFLLVPPDVFALFGSHPFAVLRAAVAEGKMRRQSPVPRSLDPLTLAGRANVVDRTAVERMKKQWGPKGFSRIVQKVLTSERLAISGATDPEKLFSAIISCLPKELRVDFSFASGLKFSNSRPFRVLLAPCESDQQRQLARRGCEIWDLDLASEQNPTNDDDSQTEHGWARFIRLSLEYGRVADMTKQLQQHRPNVTLASLDALGQELADRIPQVNESSPDTDDWRDTRTDVSVPPSIAISHHGTIPSMLQSEPSVATICVERSLKPDGVAAISAPCHDPHIVAQLELLDDLVFDAINGSYDAMKKFFAEWPNAISQLGHDVVGESRKHYVRFALQVWNEREADDKLLSKRCADALDVLCVLMQTEG